MTLTEFKRFANENNIVPVPTEIYSKMINDIVKYAKMKKVLQEIRQEMAESKYNHHGENNRELAFNICLQIIDKHIKEIEGSDTE